MKEREKKICIYFFFVYRNFYRRLGIVVNENGCLCGFPFFSLNFIMHVFSPLAFCSLWLQKSHLQTKIIAQLACQFTAVDKATLDIWVSLYRNLASIYFFPFLSFYCTNACLPLSPEPKHAILSAISPLITILSSILLTGTPFHKTIYQNLNYHHGARFYLDIPTRVPIIAPDHISCCDRVNHNYCESCLLNTLTGWIINHSSPWIILIKPLPSTQRNWFSCVLAFVDIYRCI